MKQSLAALALMVALASGSAWADEHKHGDGPPPFVKEKIASLPKDKQELILQSFAEGRAAHKANREKMKTLREDAKKILTAPSFDEEAFLTKSKEINVLMSEQHTAMAERIAALAKKLSVDERKVLADIFPKPGMRHKHLHEGDQPLAPAAE